MTKQTKNNLFNFVTDWQQPPQEYQLVGSNGGDDQTIFYLTGSLESGLEAQSLAAHHSCELQIRWPLEGIPTSAKSVIIALDELWLDAPGRRRYFDWLLEQNLPMPVVILSRDFVLDGPTLVKPGLMLAPRLDDAVFRALRDGNSYLATLESDECQAA